MSRGDKPDIVAVLFLEFEHYAGKSFVADFIFPFDFPVLTDLVVLAKDASKIAVSKKNISRAA